MAIFIRIPAVFAQPGSIAFRIGFLIGASSFSTLAAVGLLRRRHYGVIFLFISYVTLWDASNPLALVGQAAINALYFKKRWSLMRPAKPIVASQECAPPLDETSICAGPSQEIPQLQKGEEPPC